MRFTTRYESPVGELLLASDGEALTGLWLEGQKYYAAGVKESAETKDSLPIFEQTKHWLDEYFAGRRPEVRELPVVFCGSRFQCAVWQLLTEIPYGQLTTYGQLAKEYEARTGRITAARAVGGAVGRNPISILVPCHRVVGADGSITGYAGGAERKRFLLRLDGL